MTEIQKTSLLSLILKYNFNVIEAKAWKIAILYMQAEYEYYNTIYTIKLTDPRKTYLFKICYKLLKEYGEYLEIYEYKHYIQAQFQILQQLSNPNNKLMMRPAALVGKKAWNRWLVWKKNFENTVTPVEIKTSTTDTDQIKNSLLKTKAFLIKKYGSVKKELLNINDLERYFKQGKVCGWFLYGLLGEGKVGKTYIVEKELFKEIFPDIAID